MHQCDVCLGTYPDDMTVPGTTTRDGWERDIRICLADYESLDWEDA